LKYVCKLNDGAALNAWFKCRRQEWQHLKTWGIRGYIGVAALIGIAIAIVRFLSIRERAKKQPNENYKKDDTKYPI